MFKKANILFLLINIFVVVNCYAVVEESRSPTLVEDSPVLTAGSKSPLPMAVSPSPIAVESPQLMAVSPEPPSMTGLPVATSAQVIPLLPASTKAPVKGKRCIASITKETEVEVEDRFKRAMLASAAIALQLERGTQPLTAEPLALRAMQVSQEEDVAQSQDSVDDSCDHKTEKPEQRIEQESPAVVKIRQKIPQAREYIERLKKADKPVYLVLGVNNGEKADLSRFVNERDRLEIQRCFEATNNYLLSNFLQNRKYPEDFVDPSYMFMNDEQTNTEDPRSFTVNFNELVELQTLSIGLPDTFDKIYIDSSVFQFMTWSKDHLRQIKKLLKPGGQFIFVPTCHVFLEELPEDQEEVRGKTTLQDLRDFAKKIVAELSRTDKFSLGRLANCENIKISERFYFPSHVCIGVSKRILFANEQFLEEEAKYMPREILNFLKFGQKKSISNMERLRTGYFTTVNVDDGNKHALVSSVISSVVFYEFISHFKAVLEEVFQEVVTVEPGKRLPFPVSYEQIFPFLFTATKPR